MSLLRRRMMMQQNVKIIFSNLEVSKCANATNFYDVDGGIRVEFTKTRDAIAILNLVIEAGKEYDIEFDFIAEKDTWNSLLIANVYNDIQWWLTELDGKAPVFYEDGKTHYVLHVTSYTEDRKVVLIGNTLGISTGYAEFTNLIIKEV